ncbi:hypothetical protein N657DRAFT_624682 [Parathielavia appendiculata]|uniref:T6SS Phospholipase effector Tle1-like catalytic domain-containing protein n=1 Tax=Parathielavia appendiculata TaxID=2587402 RepID=A0AAN6TV90_9PEZI|nr:hypothetical protein N657DRAFT_624682 [Parathielavia appendiculata]
MDESHLKPGGHDGHNRAGSPGLDSRPGSHGEFFSTHVPSRPATPVDPEHHHSQASNSHRKPRKIILCFDGTGNKFHGDDSDSNILKIFRMLDRTASDQYHYYQPGIGTYVVSNRLSHTGTVARIKSWYQKAKDSAIGSSFDQHVVGGYRFLMRFYNPGDEIYIFGFSRGAYIARFLAEMLDYVGLLSHGNEEMVRFAWKAFSNWQSRQGDKTPEGIKKKKEMYAFMKGFRETFSRPVRRIRFLGLFDTVNSVPRFETAWMQRSRFPYTARTSAKIIRHAVSIDERRAKFRQDLIYQSGKSHKGKSAHREKLHRIGEKYREAVAPRKSTDTKRRGRREALDVPDHPAPYRARSHSSTRRTHMTEGSAKEESVHHDARSELSVAPHPHGEDHDFHSDAESEDESEQDIDEVWFAGGHADIGGGWEMLPGSKAASHVPLVWMVHEAMKAGLHFDLDKVRELGCMEAVDQMPVGTTNGNPGSPIDPSKPSDKTQTATEDQPPIPNITIRTPSTISPKPVQESNGNQKSNAANASATRSSFSESSAAPPTFREMMHKAHVALLHDSLKFGGGLPWSSVLAWKVMEYLPFRRMDLQEDGSWKPIRWPLPCGEVRDIPANARVHGSVIRRMQAEENYRPGNLIVGGGGRGVRKAPKELGIGDWVCVEHEGCPIGEVWVKREAVEGSNQNGKAKSG